jgi:hypothetical protein
MTTVVLLKCNVLVRNLYGLQTGPSDFCLKFDDSYARSLTRSEDHISKIFHSILRNYRLI